MGEKELDKVIREIFDKHRIPYEGIYESRARADLINLITKSNIELLTRLKRKIEYNENGQNKAINAAIKYFREQLRNSMND